MSVVRVTSRQGRRQWWELLDQAASGQADIVVEQDGEPVAVLIPFADYQALGEELRRLRSARRNLAPLADGAPGAEQPPADEPTTPASGEYTPF